MRASETADISIEASRQRLDRLLSFVEADPDNLNLLADAADMALKWGDLEAARSAVVRGLELRPGDPFFSLRLSSVALAEGNLDEALGLTGQLLAAGYEEAPVRYNHAYALVCLRRFAEARPVLLALQSEQALPALVGRLLVRTHHYLGEVEEAIAVAVSCLQADPQNGEMAGMLSLLYVDADEMAQARAWAGRALALAPESIDALLAASTVALAAEDSDAARSFAHRGLAVQPRNGRVWSSLGLADMLNFDFSAAHENLTQAVHYMPEHIGTWHLLGWVKLLQKDLDGAEDCFNQALAVDNNFGETHGALAAVAAMRGDWAHSDALAKTARRLDPDSMYSQYAEILRLQRDGRSDLVQHMFDRALREGKSPGGGNLHDMLGRVMCRKQTQRPRH